MKQVASKKIIYPKQPVLMVFPLYFPSKSNNERELFLRTLPQFDPNDLFLLDRGLGGSSVYIELYKNEQFFLHRAISSGPKAQLYIQGFVQSRKSDVVVSIELEVEGEKIALPLRLVKGPKDSEGKRIVFVTNLLDSSFYSRESILSLYKKRWGIETMYGRLKQIIHVEKFHSKTYTLACAYSRVNSKCVASATIPKTLSRSDFTIFALGSILISYPLRNAYPVSTSKKTRTSPLAAKAALQIYKSKSQNLKRSVLQNRLF